MNIENALAMAKKFFSELKSANGYVVYTNGAEAGWTRELDRPKSWQPDSLAINQAGDVYKAVGGDDYHGAKEWQPLIVHAPLEASKVNSFDTNTNGAVAATGCSLDASLTQDLYYSYPRTALQQELAQRFPEFRDVFLCIGVAAMFNGHNHEECAKAFNMTQNSVYCIVKYASLMHQAAVGKTSVLLWQGRQEELAGPHGYVAGQSDAQKLAKLGVVDPAQAWVSVRLELAPKNAADRGLAGCECNSAKTPLSTDSHAQPEHGAPEQE